MAKKYGLIYARDEMGEFVIVERLEDGIFKALTTQKIEDFDSKGLEDYITEEYGEDWKKWDNIFEYLECEQGWETYDIYELINFYNKVTYPAFEKYMDWRISELETRYPEYSCFYSTIEEHCW